MLQTLPYPIRRFKKAITRLFPFLAAMPHGSPQSYVLTLALMGFALWVRLAIAPVNAGLQYVTFFPAVTLATIVGGYRAGLLATLVGLALATYIFTPPYYSLSIEVLLTSAWSNLVFLTDGIIMSYAIEAMHRYRQRYARELQQSRDAHAALEESTQYLKTIIDNLYAYVALLDVHGIVQEVNKASLERAGCSRAEVIGKHFCDTLWWAQDPAVRTQLMASIEAASQGQTQRRDLVVCVGDDRMPIDFQISPVRDGDGRVVGLLPIGVDISERKRIETELRIAAAAFESQEGIMVTDADCAILRINTAFTRTTGYTAEEVIGQSPRIVQSGRHDAAFYAAMWDSINRTGSWEGEIWNRHKDGTIHPKWLSITAVKSDDGTVTHYVGAETDITERKEIEESVRYLASYDSLTKLPNRRLLNDRLSQAMAAGKRGGFYGALMFFDLDNFKPLNDAHGHEVGDLLLLEAANRLKNCIRETDTVARFGGDEFVVVLCELNTARDKSVAQAMAVAEKIRSRLSEPYFLLVKCAGQENTETVEHHCSASIGVTVFSNHEISQEDILKQADLAMYQAKESGRNRIRLHQANHLL